MAINIFAVDGDSAVKQDAYEDSPIVGRFRAGYQVNKLPVGLSAWRFTTSDKKVAGKIAELLGSEDDNPVSEWDTSTGEIYQVFTTSDEVDIVLDGRGSAKASLVLWGAQSKILETDGSYLYDDDGKITEDRCDMTYGKTLKELKEMARVGKGPKPNLQVYFTIAAAPELGKMRFYAGAWTAMDEFDEASDIMETAKSPQLFSLEMEKNEFTNDKGEVIKYTRPRLIHKGDAEEPF